MGSTVQLTGALGSTFAAGGLAAFALCVHALGQQRDLSAVLWLAIAGLLIKGSGDLLGEGSGR